MGEPGGSAEHRAAELRARGKPSAGAWAAGAEGERRVAAALSELPPTWLVLHDRLLFPGRRETNLDHVLVGPAGVFLIDAKNWAGTLSEYVGGVFKHANGPDGERRHVRLDREFDGVHHMATEMARRIQVGVTVVIALAGSRAEEFGAPRVVRNAWVVPVGKLAGWLQSRPAVGLGDPDRLGVLVRTEFPSTTTDWRLLAAMGMDLDRRGVLGAPSRGTRVMPRHPSSRGPVPSHHQSRGPKARKSRAGGKRRPSIPRLLVALGLLAVLWWAVSTGSVFTAAATFSTWLTGRVMASAGEVEAPAGDATLGCAGFDPATAKEFRRLALQAHDTGHGCEWRATTKAGNVRLLRIEERNPYNPMTAPLAESKAARSPVLRTGATADGRVTVLHVAKGAEIKRGKLSVPATRDLQVWVAHEATGLTASQGRQLAVRVALVLSQASATPTPAASH